MKCFYHNDEDGKVSAFWVNNLAKHTDGYEKEFMPINYGKDFPFEEILPNEQVYIVDYSILPDEMKHLLNITKNVVWIDHHFSAIKRYESFPYEISGLRYDGIAGCMLTYCYLKHMTDGGEGFCKSFDFSMMDDAPMFTKYVADFDVWKFEYGKDTKAFEIGLQLYEQDPISGESVWYYLCSPLLSELSIIKQGYTLLRYRDNWAKDYCSHVGFDAEFESYKCFALNLGMITSDYFNSLNHEEYDMFIGFSYNGKSWNYSLRSTKVNCAEIAMKYGGGGHPGAAGLSSDEFLLKRIGEKENERI